VSEQTCTSTLTAAPSSTGALEVRAPATPSRPTPDEGGFRHAWDRETRCQAWLDRISRDLGVPVAPGEGARWAQAAEGDQARVRILEDAFHTLRRDGRISRFPRRGITSARQGTCAPYGLPAVLLHLNGVCRVNVERLGSHLLQASPRLLCLTELQPGVVLVENTPPLDGIWDESRFWASWQSLPAEAWSDVGAWAAVRVLRYFESPAGRWEFFDRTTLPRKGESEVTVFDPAPVAGGVGESGEWTCWRRRRCAEIALALQPLHAIDDGLRSHVLGRLATPHPFLRPLGDDATVVTTIEEWLASAAATLNAAYLRDAAAPKQKVTDKAVTAAESGLRRIQRELLAAPSPVQHGSHAGHVGFTARASHEAALFAARV
jgi:hypothetical protein